MTRALLASFATPLKAGHAAMLEAIWRSCGNPWILTMRLALYQPDIPQNTGTILRMAACLDIPVDLIGPAGFDYTDRAFRRAGLDYLDHLDITRHESFEAFQKLRAQSGSTRLVLLTASGAIRHDAFSFAQGDVLLLGRESAGVPASVHAVADARVRIPLRAHMRSLNIAISAAIVLGEALRQTSGFPSDALANQS